MNILKKRIGCSKFLALIKKSIKAGYKANGKFYDSNTGLFQGNVTSPILNNIYLHEFDFFMQSLSESFRKGYKRRGNPVYRKISYQISKTSSPIEKRVKCRLLWKVDSLDNMDPNFKRLCYVRYVDDFIVGVIGSRKDTVRLEMCC
jgi:retron-type reverse transcriptase